MWESSSFARGTGTVQHLFPAVQLLTIRRFAVTNQRSAGIGSESKATVAVIDQLQGLWHRLAGRPEIWWLVLLLAALMAFRWYRQWSPRRKSKHSQTSPLAIDVQTLSPPDVDVGPMSLRVYHVPVRLGLVVVAPLGRDIAVPQESEIPRLLDRTVPGLGRVMENERPASRIWPAQLSADGFRHAFFRHVNLPSGANQESKWCLVAGRISVGTARYVLGLALCAAELHNLGTIAVESEHRWLDVVRIA